MRTVGWLRLNWVPHHTKSTQQHIKSHLHRIRSHQITPTTLHHTTWHYMTSTQTSHYITPNTSHHSTIAAHQITSHYTIPQHNTAQHSTAQHSTAQHSTAQHSTAQHSTAQHSTAQHSTAQHSTAQHSTAQHSTAQHSTAQHSTTHYLSHSILHSQSKKTHEFQSWELAQRIKSNPQSERWKIPILSKHRPSLASNTGGYSRTAHNQANLRVEDYP